MSQRKRTIQLSDAQVVAITPMIRALGQQMELKRRKVVAGTTIPSPSAAENAVHELYRVLLPIETTIARESESIHATE